VERDKPKQSESVGQTLLQLPWKQKRGDLGYQFPTSKSTMKPNFAQIGGFLYFGGHFGFKIAAIANQR
jgi:hypothetical protein